MEATEPLVKYSNTCITYCLFAVTATTMLQANVTSILVMSQGKYLIHLIHLFLTIIAAKVERKFYNFLHEYCLPSQDQFRRPPGRAA